MKKLTRIEEINRQRYFENNTEDEAIADADYYNIGITHIKSAEYRTNLCAGEEVEASELSESEIIEIGKEQEE